MLYGQTENQFIKNVTLSLNPYFFGKCSTALIKRCSFLKKVYIVLILIFLENALRPKKENITVFKIAIVLILIFLENALRLIAKLDLIGLGLACLNPYFFGKCSTAYNGNYVKLVIEECVLILIFLENALRPNVTSYIKDNVEICLNPYFFGKCSTASANSDRFLSEFSLNPYFFGKCSTAF